MTKREKVFQALVGVTVEKVDASAVNQLILIDKDGYEYTIDAEVDGMGIPHLSLTKVIPD